ncbi:hypothetical protein ASC84_06300 [Acinetobacter sp. Root1280]|nr:hypothetical protein ASC84_06300 [Acinetobacter sp. Root1280]
MEKRHFNQVQTLMQILQPVRENQMVALVNLAENQMRGVGNQERIIQLPPHHHLVEKLVKLN